MDLEQLSYRDERGVEALRYKAITGPISPAIVRSMVSGSLPPVIVGDSVDDLCAALASAAKCFVVDIVSTARAIQENRSPSTTAAHNEPIQAAHLLEAYRTMQLRGNILGLRHSVTDEAALHTDAMADDAPAAAGAQGQGPQGEGQGQAPAGDDSLPADQQAEEAPAPAEGEEEGAEAEEGAES